MRKLFSQIITLPFLFVVLSLMFANQANSSEWRVQKMSGDVWVETNQPTKIALTKDTVLQNGDKIKTGKNGRVLLMRNKETILVSPNSLIGLPQKAAEKGKTIILQQMGEILLDVEKRNVKHFEVSTPYLAAVVKGTQFRVTVDEEGSKVNVLRGKVEVSDFKTGQFVLVKPGQTALVQSPKNKNNVQGLLLKGAGEKETIQKGSPKKQRVAPLKSNKFRSLKNKSQVTKFNKKNKDVPAAKVKTTKNFKNANKVLKIKSQKSKLKLTPKLAQKLRKTKLSKSRKRKVRVKRMRIGRAIGQVRLNVYKSTNGLSRSNKFANLSNKRQKKRKSKTTFWAKTNNVNTQTVSSSVTQNNNVASNKGNNGNGNNGNGNGNNGNGNGNNGNGNGNNGNGNGNNGNGNGNNGNGNGNN